MLGIPKEVQAGGGRLCAGPPGGVLPAGEGRAARPRGEGPVPGPAGRRCPSSTPPSTSCAGCWAALWWSAPMRPPQPGAAAVFGGRARGRRRAGDRQLFGRRFRGAAHLWQRRGGDGGFGAARWLPCTTPPLRERGAGAGRAPGGEGLRVGWGPAPALPLPGAAAGVRPEPRGRRGARLCCGGCPLSARFC